MNPILRSKSFPFVLLLVLSIIIAAATLVEEFAGTTVAHQTIYSTWWFRVLWMLVVCCGLRLLYLTRMWRRPLLLLFHLSLVIILVGALTTAISGRKGVIHLRKGIPVNTFQTHSSRSASLPFTLRLDSFYIRYYPGTKAPQDYVSLVTVHPGGEQISLSMNRIASLQHHRLYQSSYDPDLQGSVLTLNHDPLGIGLTYAGYLLLGLSMMGLSLPLSWRRRMGRWMLLCCLWFGAQGVQARDMPPLPCISSGEAAVLEERQVMWNDRVTPLGVACHDVLLKLYGEDTFQGLTPTQVVTSWSMWPQVWNTRPIIRKGRGEYVRFSDYVDYTSMPPRLKPIAEQDGRLAEKLGLVMMLMEGSLFQPVPDEVDLLSPRKVKVTLFYASTPWPFWGMVSCFILSLCCGLLLWSERSGERIPPLSRGLHSSAFVLVVLWLLSAFFLRWYVAGHIPLSNGYETMLFVALCLLLIALFNPRFSFRGLAALCAAFLLLVAYLGQRNPQITPLMPVLHSPWLSAHVSIIMWSYALLILSFVERRLLRPAVFCLAAGIFLGAVWANVSWGTYWSWDPKESWALITMLVYSIPLHSKSLPWFRSMRHYRLYSLVALACLLMTYFGVNYFLGGMHSYGAQ